MLRRSLSSVVMGHAVGRRSLSAKAVDVHTHVYLPRYLQMLRDRTAVPRILPVDGEDRLVILPGEDEEVSTSTGRPVGGEYYDPARKIAFMDTHGIDVSVLSLANPWLDFLDAPTAIDLATALNEDLQQQCDDSAGRFYGFGVVPSQDVDAACAELERIHSLSKLRGIILSTHGLGEGLDDPRLLPLYQTVERLGQVIFLHPHYGVGTEHFGGYGHALFLALGFTFETTTAVSRLICSGMLDKVPDLKLLLAHSGGTLPFLAGRLDSCVSGDPHLQGKLKHAPSDYLKRMYYDSIVYHNPALDCSTQLVGADRLMFGTDHPFFPPPGVTGEAIDTTPWKSTTSNIDVAERSNDTDAILRENAYRLLDIAPLEA